MTLEAARREMQHRNASLEPAVRHRWFVRAAGEGTGRWTLLKVVGLPADVLGPMTTTTEAKPRPPQADDPRPAHWQNVGGPWVPFGCWVP